MMPEPKALQQAAVPLKVIDVVDHALKTRLLGGSTFHSGFDSLNSVLNLQFRLHYHVLGSKGLAKPSLRSFVEGLQTTGEEPRCDGGIERLSRGCKADREDPVQLLWHTFLLLRPIPRIAALLATFFKNSQ